MADNPILFDFSPWFIPLCFIAGLIYAILLYYQKNPWGRMASLILAGFRFLLVTCIALLLLGPLIRFLQNTIYDPFYVIVIDNSRSVHETYTESELNIVREGIGKIFEGFRERDIEVRVKDIQGRDYASPDSVSFNASSTDLNQVLLDVENEFESKNLAGVVLISDGIYNHGSSPLYRNYSFPVYSVGIGDTTEKEDIILKSLNHNKIVYQGNKFQLQADIYNKGFMGETITLNLRHNGRILEKKYMSLPLENGFQTVTFEVDAEESGLQRYIVSIEPRSDEFLIENNTLSAFVEIVEGKEKILLLANAPHPDIKALKSIIEKNDNYELLTIIPGINEVPEQEYDLVILHQLPDSRNTFNQEIQIYKSKETPILYIMGSTMNVSRFNQQNNVLDIRPLRNQRDQVFSSLNPNFSLFNVHEKFKNNVSELPPINVPFGEYTLKGESEIVLYQRIGKVTTQKPLLLINRNQSLREAVMTGEGLWKWRLNEYLNTGSSDGIDDLFNKVVQFLSAKEDRRNFKVYPLRNENWNTEAVIFENEIYNEIFERIFDQKIDLILTDEEGKSYEYSYVISQANSQFRINGLLPGVYEFVAKTSRNGNIRSVSGMFTVKEMLIELSNLKADFGLLRELARRSSGTFSRISDMHVLTEELAAREVPSLIYSQESYLAIINLKWILFLLLALASLEWGLRKYLGGY